MPSVNLTPPREYSYLRQVETRLKFPRDSDSRSFAKKSKHGERPRSSRRAELGIRFSRWSARGRPLHAHVRTRGGGRWSGVLWW